MIIHESKRGVTIKISKKDLDEAMHKKETSSACDFIGVNYTTGCNFYDRQHCIVVKYDSVVPKDEEGQKMNAQSLFKIQWGAVIEPYMK